MGISDNGYYIADSSSSSGGGGDIWTQSAPANRIQQYIWKLNNKKNYDSSSSSAGGPSSSTVIVTRDGNNNVVGSGVSGTSLNFTIALVATGQFFAEPALHKTLFPVLYSRLKNNGGVSINSADYLFMLIKDAVTEALNKMQSAAAAAVGFDPRWDSLLLCVIDHKMGSITPIFFGDQSYVKESYVGLLTKKNNNNAPILLNFGVTHTFKQQQQQQSSSNSSGNNSSSSAAAADDVSLIIVYSRFYKPFTPASELALRLMASTSTSPLTSVGNKKKELEQYGIQNKVAYVVFLSDLGTNFL